MNHAVFTFGATSLMLDRLGLTLLHTLWEGAAIAVLAAIALACLRRAAPQARYVAACFSMVLFICVSVSTFFALAERRPIVAPSSTVSATSNIQQQATDDISDAQQRLANNSALDKSLTSEGVEIPILSSKEIRGLSSSAVVIHPYLPAIAFIWLLGITAMSLFRISGWLHIQRLVRRASPPIPRWLDALSGLSRRMCIAFPIRLLQSTRVESPCVVGWLRPIILLPVSLLTDLPPAQLEAILAHELAHIRRHDYVVNLIQTALETLLFYHPATWWLSAQIRCERENCCDDLAAKTTGSALIYAKALASLEELRVVPSPALAVNDGNLLPRIRRILGRGESPRSVAGVAPAILLALMLLLLPLVTRSQESRTRVPSRSTIPSTASSEFILTINTPAGKPAAGAVVAVIDNGNVTQLSPDGTIYGRTFFGDRPEFIAGDDGVVRLSIPARRFILAVTHDSGYLEVSPDSLVQSKVIQLNKWGRVRGILRIGSKSAPGELVELYTDSHSLPNDIPQTMHGVSARTDSNGRFTLDHVPPGPFQIFRNVNMPAQIRRGSVASGDTATLAVGGTGRPIIGVVEVPQVLMSRNNWHFDPATLQKKIPDVPMPDTIKAGSVEQQLKWTDDFYTSEAGRVYINAVQGLLFLSGADVRIDASGAFRVEDLEPGTYTLTGSIAQNYQDGWVRLARGTMEFIIQDMPGGRSDEPLQLPPVKLTLLPSREEVLKKWRATTQLRISK